MKGLADLSEVCRTAANDLGEQSAIAIVKQGHRPVTAGFRIGIDLGGTKIEAAAIDRLGAIRARRRVATPAGDYDATVAAVTGLVHAIEAELAGPITVGVGIPGTAVERTGLVKNANSTWLIGRPLGADLAAALGREVRLHNDANFFAFSGAGERAPGAGG